MNTQKKQLTESKSRGFTIIEVVLVLAIAGLIFVMVFIALPSLQRGQRDTQRRSDLSRISTQIQNYSSSNRGDVPDAVRFVDGTTGFVLKYLSGVSGTQAGKDYADPSTGDGYKFTTTATDPAAGEVNYQINLICGLDGAAVRSYNGLNATSRNYVLRTYLEGQKTPYCVDNR